jgi:hypothetical protein
MGKPVAVAKVAKEVDEEEEASIGDGDSEDEAGEGDDNEEAQAEEQGEGDGEEVPLEQEEEGDGDEVEEDVADDSEQDQEQAEGDKSEEEQTVGEGDEVEAEEGDGEEDEGDVKEDAAYSGSDVRFQLPDGGEEEKKGKKASAPVLGMTPKALAKFTAAVANTGVVYLSRIPPFMKVSTFLVAGTNCRVSDTACPPPQVPKIRHMLSQYGEIDRIYLTPEGANKPHELLNLQTFQEHTTLRSP